MIYEGKCILFELSLQMIYYFASYKWIQFSKHIEVIDRIFNEKENDNLTNIKISS